MLQNAFAKDRNASTSSSASDRKTVERKRYKGVGSTGYGAPVIKLLHLENEPATFILAHLGKTVVCYIVVVQRLKSLD